MRPTRVAVALAIVSLAVASVVAACGAPGASPRDPAPPEGFALAGSGLPMAPALATLTSGVVPAPIGLAVTRYELVGTDATGATGATGATDAITRTVATFASPSGALAAYNGWFARYGFPAVAVRTRLELGDMAENFTLAWPPLHAVLVREGDRFILVEGDDAVPAEMREPAMAALAAGGLSAPVVPEP